jgi:outer membrane protein OmpA-like peptidoglycan-associated protein
MRTLVVPCLLVLAGCGGGTSYVKSDTTLGRVVVYRNGVAYFERFARVEGDTLSLSVPADKVDDFLKSLTVVDAKTGKPAPIAYPTSPQAADPATGLIDMNITLQGAGPHDLKLSYVSEAPSWKPSYRVVIGKNNKVNIQAWAIVDNTSGEDWKSVKLGVGSSSALSFRFDLRSVRTVQRETLKSDDLFAVAPPTGGASHGGDYRGVEGKPVVVELTDESPELNKRDGDGVYELDAATTTAEVTVAGKSGGRKAQSFSAPQRQAESAPSTRPPAQSPKPVYGTSKPPVAPPQGSYGGQAAPNMNQQQQQQGQGNINTMAQKLRQTRGQVVVEGYADKNDQDKFASSLERANRVREQLIRNGVSPEQVVAVGNGERAGRPGGVRIVEATPAGAREPSKKPEPTPDALAGEQTAEPIGTSHFESQTPMDVGRGTSAMVSILHTDTNGEVVFFFDPESARGNTAFPFRAVRIRNPTDSVLESGPVTVFGEGKFIGEGLCDPIPARSIAFVPFALDRQIVVDKDEAERDEIARILSVQRGVFSTEVQHTRRIKLTLNNRLDERATVYIRHTVAKGYKLGIAPKERERLGAAHLFRVDVAPNGKSDVVIEESTPLFKTTDIRSPEGVGLVKVFLSSAAAEGPLKSAVSELLRVQTEIGNLEQQITTVREQMQEYRARMDELHVQIVTLKAVKTSGTSLMQHLEKKLTEVSEKLSKATVDLVGVQEKLMVARIRFQDGVAELSLEKKPDAADPAAPAKPGTKI